MKASLPSRIAWSAYTFAQARRETRIPWLPTERLLTIQRRRVQHIVRYAQRHVPFYRDAMATLGLRPDEFRDADDLARLPLIDGATYGADPARFQSTDERLGDVLTISSSGTTGRTKAFRYDGRALVLALAHGHRQRHVLAHFTGRLAGYRELNLQRDGSVSTQIRNYYEEHLWTPRRVDLTRESLTPGELPLAAEVARINAFRPDVIIGYGSYLGALYRSINARGLTMHTPTVLVYGADGMAAADRRYIEQQLGIPVVSMYQSTESLRIGFQCERRQGLHLSIDAVAVRVVDTDGRTVAPGEAGHVVLSNLTNRATVLLNYRLGDVAVRGTEACACGRTLPLLESLEGRSDDLIRLEDGRTLHALQVLRRLRDAAGEDRVQLVQQAPRRFLVRVVNDSGGEREAVAGRLTVEIGALIGERCDVAIEWVDVLPTEANGKTRMVISHVSP
ncbi:MAG: phenylacetate--CoA ligase family protein [Gemmatimonadaceae bacterium]|nr:phenylacetate--CoA ligase family protein [Gemmatimonadaceae bacterium]